MGVFWSILVVGKATLKCCILISLLMVMMGCSFNPKSLPPQIARTGYVSLSSSTFAGWIYMRSDTYVPGDIQTSGELVRRRCPASGNDIRIEFDGIVERHVDGLCAVADMAADYVSLWFPGHRVSYSIIVVPEGRSVSVTRRSLRYRSAHLTLAVPVFSDEMRTRGNLVDLMAHEGFHALGRVAADRYGEDEGVAYYAGLCAQLEVLGEIIEFTLPGAPLPDSKDEAVRISSGAGYQVRREVFPLLVNGRIYADARSGHVLAGRCDLLRRGSFAVH